jgi:hypothetical protein
VGAELFRESFQAGDIDRLIADLAPDFAFYHTALPEPTTDAELLRKLLKVARETIGEDFRFTEHATGDGLHALRWTSTIGGLAAEGVDVVREDAEGRISEIRITMRPMQANAAWSDAMRERFGVPPEGAR